MVLERIGGGMVRLGHSNCSLGLWQAKLKLLQLIEASMSQFQRSNVGLLYER